MSDDAGLTKKFTFAGVPNTTKSEGTHLSADPTGQTDRICFASGRSAVVRSISNPTDVCVFLQHTMPVTCVRFSHDAKMVASADESGTVKVWNPLTGVQMHEIRGSSAPIRDLCIHPDAKFIIVGGEARGTTLKCLKFPSGSAAGNCAGHQKRVVACDVSKAQKLIVGASEDFKVSLHKGPPVGEYAVPTMLSYHTNFVNDVRFAPDGSKFASCSTDRTVCIVDSVSQQVIHTMTDHEASVLQLSWNKEGTEIVSCGSDKTIRFWDVASGKQISCITVGSNPEDMQQSVCWIPKTNEIVSVSLPGYMNVWEKDATTPKAILRGHAKPCVGLTAIGDKFYTGDYTGTLVAWEVGKGPLEKGFSGSLPTTMACLAGGKKYIATVGMDDKVFLIPTETLVGGPFVTVKGGGKDISVPSSGNGPIGCLVISEGVLTAVGPDCAVIAEMKLETGQKGESVAVNADGSLIAYCVEITGSAGEIYFATVEGGKFVPVGEKITLLTSAHKMEFNQEGSILLVGETSRRISFFSVPSGEKLPGGGIVHSARVDGVCWTPDGKYGVTGGLEGNIGVWLPTEKGEYRRYKGAHRAGITGIGVTACGTIVSTGGDNAIISWSL